MPFVDAWRYLEMRAGRRHAEASSHAEHLSRAEGALIACARTRAHAVRGMCVCTRVHILPELQDVQASDASQPPRYCISSFNPDVVGTAGGGGGVCGGR
jgi:hypothetical protein